MEDKDGKAPQNKGAVKSLKQLPMYDASKTMSKDNHPADDYLRDQCLRCHLWSQGARQDGDYRASGCAACHVVYSDNGIYEGGDKAIDKKQIELERIVDEDGKQIQATSHYGARPFNKKEIDRIMRVNVGKGTGVKNK